MKASPLEFAFLLSFLFVLAMACQRHEHDAPSHKPAAEDATHANEHMHQNSFEELLAHFEDPERDRWQRPRAVLEALGDLSGKTVADIGAGSGYFAFRIAPHAAKVIAIDIDQRFLDYIQEKNAALEAPLPIETRLAAPDDPKLAPGEADVVLIVNTYHHIENRREYFSRVCKNLAAGGRLVVIDFFKKELPMGPPPEIKLPAATVEKELRSAGFSEIRIDKSTLPYQYIVIAKC